uniref:(northern house mosquito) hypothetical protein n=1 Tax=Culex pipiens TaxID=7175 RepID=A0A8D8HYI0_CULPI
MLALSYSFFAVHSISLITLAAHSPRSTHSLSSLSFSHSRARAPTNLVSSLQTFFVAEYSSLQSATAASSSPSFITLVVFLLFFFGRFKRFASTPEPNGPNC